MGSGSGPVLACTSCASVVFSCINLPGGQRDTCCTVSDGLGPGASTGTARRHSKSSTAVFGDFTSGCSPARGVGCLVQCSERVDGGVMACSLQKDQIVSC